MRTVQSVQRRPVDLADPTTPGWEVLLKDDANTTGLTAHRFPDTALHWRAAEYGIDPADAETLLDVVLHEPLFALHHDDPTFLYNTDEATARRAHLERVAKAKAAHGLADPAGLLHQIHEHHRGRHDPEAHRRKQQEVARLRAGRIRTEEDRRG